jgi:hypothetical protein
MKHLDDTTILRAEVGSTAHGITHGSNDIDEIAVFVPPPTDVLGVGNLADSISYRPGRKADEPSQPGDLDRVYHSLRKFVSLLVKGNPSILFTLYAPILVTTPLGHDLVRRRHLMVHDSTRARYLGYMTSQRQRITGERGAAGRIRRSPEGGGEIDWKYAMHMLRLGHQSYEYLTLHHIAAPVEEPLRSHLLAVRHGEIPLKAVLREAERLEAKVAALELERPTQTYFDEWSTWLADAHLTYWSTQ